MGKSNKKLKNDRINTIRKQYDAFLEEDKKRRERNEYILVKLDKMRSSTALVPISTKARYHMELNPLENIMHPSNLRTQTEMQDSYVSHLGRQNVNSEILNKPIDELQILKEISKKYILIPKRITPIENIYSKDVIVEDWRSKYNILDDLKKLEKEGRSDPIYEQDNDSNTVNRGFDLSTGSNIADIQPSKLGSDASTFDNTILPKNNEFKVSESLNSPVKQDKINTQVNFNIPEVKDHEKENNIPLQIPSTSLNETAKAEQTQSAHTMQGNINFQENVTEIEKYNSESTEKDLKLLTNNISPQVCEMSSINHPTAYQENVNPNPNTPKTDTNVYLAPENSKENINNVIISEQTISDVKSQKTDVVETTNLDQDIDKQRAINEVQDVTYAERIEVHHDIDNNPGEQIVAQETTVDTSQPHHEPTQNTVPADNEHIQNPEHVEHESEINAFETEQKEMFYSEQADPDNYGYGHGEGNTGEYPDGYEQNEQYGYYEGVQQEAPYATNINEHEESTERYDPHYNQQYEGSYENQQPDPVDYENTNAYEQQQFDNENAQFENVVNYENQQENVQLYQQENVADNELQENVLMPQDGQMYDQNLYAEHQETQEHIEQQLTAEEGYLESSPVVADGYQKENEGEIQIENVVNITHEEPMPEPKLA